MWNCAVCDAEIEDDTWDVCWKCMTDRRIKPEEAQDLRKKLEAPIDPSRHAYRCLRCDTPMIHAGTKKFHEGTRFGTMGDIGEWFINREGYEVHCCPKCGKVEFFLEGSELP